MASSSFPSSKLIHGFNRPKSCSCVPQFQSIGLGNNLSQTPLSFRLRNATKLQLRTRLYTLFASKSSPSDGDSSKKKFDGIMSSDDAQGPPFLTILAGFLVFSLICWVIGSITMWLFGQIVKVPPSK